MKPSMALCVVLLLATGCASSAGTCQPRFGYWAAVDATNVLHSLTYGLETQVRAVGLSRDVPDLMKIAREGTAEERCYLAIFLTDVLKVSRSPDLAERAIPVFLEIMNHPDDRVQVRREPDVFVWPAAICEVWFMQHTSAWPGIPSCDDGRKPRGPIPCGYPYLSWYPHSWPLETDSDRKAYARVREICQEWYEARKGRLAFGRVEGDEYLNTFYYGDGVDDFIGLTPAPANPTEESKKRFGFGDAESVGGDAGKGSGAQQSPEKAR